MAINLRGSTPIPDGSITESKLADNAVTTNKLATDAVTDVKIASSAVTETKIATDAVSETKIVNGAVTLTKVVEDIVTQHFFGTEVELSTTGVTEVSVGEFNFMISPDTASNWKSLAYSGKIKTDNVANNALFQLYIDGSPVGTQEQVNTTAYSIIDDQGIDLSSLLEGSHLVEVKLANGNAAGITTLGQLDLFLSKV